jgi:hypothetical protein
MRLFDVAQPVSAGKLVLPYAMRAALGWHAGMRLFCWSHSGADAPPAAHHNQLSISAYPPKARELWHFAARFRDRPGILAELTSLLTDLQIDVIMSRASTHLQNSEFSVDMEIDTSSYESTFDLSRDKRQSRPARGLPELHARLVCTFIKEIVFLPDGTPSCRLTRNPMLTGTASSDEFRYTVNLQKHGLITIPTKAMDAIRTAFKMPPPKRTVRKAAAAPLVMLVADSRWGVVDATFYYRNTGYMHARITARDQLATLELIMAELKSHGFNLLQFYSRVIANSGRAILDVLLFLPGDRTADDDRLKAYIVGTLHGKNLKELSVKVTFPEPTAGMVRKVRS